MQWRTRCSAIVLSAMAEGFDMTRFVRTVEVEDPHARHPGVRFEALVRAEAAQARIEDVALPLSRGTWMPPTELCEAHTIARRGVLDEIVKHHGDVESQMAVLATAFVHSHVICANRRRYAWPLEASGHLVGLAMAHLSSTGTTIVLPVKGSYALMGTAHMCRSAPEPLCTGDAELDRSVGRHIAMSFRETTLLSISVKAGGIAPASTPKSQARELLALGAEDLSRMVRDEGLESICGRYGMKMRDLEIACRRRGIDTARMAA